MIKMGVYGIVRFLFYLLPSPPAILRGDRHRLRPAVRRLRRPLRHRAARPEAAAGVPQRREHRHHPHRDRGRVPVPGHRTGPDAAPAPGRGLFHVLNHATVQGAALHGRRRGPTRATHTQNIEQLGGLMRGMPLTGARLPARDAGHLRRPADERVRERVRHLPGAVGRRGKRRGPAGRPPRHHGGARPHRGARVRLLRQGRRHGVPRATRAARRRRRRATPVDDDAADGGARALVPRDSASSAALVLEPPHGDCFLTPSPVVPAGVAVFDGGSGSRSPLRSRWRSPSGGSLLLTLRCSGGTGSARYDTWACGFSYATPRMQYTASSFAEPDPPRLPGDPPSALVLAGAALRALPPRGGAFETHIDDLLENGLYLPVYRLFIRLAFLARRLHPGYVHVYLALHPRGRRDPAGLVPIRRGTST